MAIPQEFLDELTGRTDIVDIVSGYCSLQRKGGRYWGCCPFHNEKTPSFSVRQDRQQYYCFGCHKGGGVINFIMDAENLPFRDAVELLAERAGMTMPEEDHPGSGQGQKQRERLYALNKDAARYFHSVLMSPAGAPMLDYLTNRGLSRRTITNFGLGAVPDGWDNLIRAMAEKGYSKGELLECGLAVKNSSGRIYDRFRNRVMFPIIDLRGNVIGFGGRVMDDSTPKYLNSPDTMIYNKSRNLFALNIARKSKQGRLILTEGYMDTIALHQAGFDCAVASLGTSLTEEHARLISQYTREVIISYDGDEAGVRAAQRAIGILEKTGLSVRVLQVTGAKDPDEFIKKYGAEAFNKLINRSGNHIEYRLQQLQSRFDLTKDDEKVKYLQEAAKLIAGLSSPVEREVYGTRAAEAAKLSPDIVRQEVERAGKQKRRKDRKQEQRSAMNLMRNSQPQTQGLRYQNIVSARAEEEVLRQLFADLSLFRKTEGRLSQEDFTSETLGKIFGLFREAWQQGREINFSALAAYLTQEEMSLLSAILDRPRAQGGDEQALNDSIDRIKKEQIRQAGCECVEALLALGDQKANGGHKA